MKLADRKRQIMEVGLELIARQGYYNTSVADIIREIGIARGTFYRYFIDKQDLFNYIISEHVKYGMEVVPQLPFDRFLSQNELEARIIQGFRDFLAIPTSGNFVQMVVETMASEQILRDLVVNFKNFFMKGFSSYFQMMQKKSFFRGHDADILAFLILALIKETFLQWVIYRDFDDLERLVHEMISLVIYGLNPPLEK